MSDDEADLWPVIPSEVVGDTLSDPDVSPKLFSVVAALTVAICENPWLEGSNSVGDDADSNALRPAPIRRSPACPPPRGGGDRGSA